MHIFTEKTLQFHVCISELNHVVVSFNMVVISNLMTYNGVACWRYSLDCLRHSRIFSLDALKVWWSRLRISLVTVGRGE